MTPPNKDAVSAIRQLYLRTTRATIHRDLQQAIRLLKTLHSEADREKAAVYMDGLSQMRAEWPSSGPESRRPRSRSRRPRPRKP